MTPTKDLTQLIIEGIHERKGRGVTIIDLSNIETSAASCFVIAEGTSAIHTQAIADSVYEYMFEKAGVKPYNLDCPGNGDWAILDYGSVWVHIFLPETRRRYNLEELWSDAPSTDVPDLD
ncbi:MAG: ribosome silencing factor [Muribaculaceae bacterium]|nr:ribosome silencing factor [Muribaculaceae bacterium]